MEINKIQLQESDINSILGVPDNKIPAPELSLEEKREKLKLARNANRGHPRKGESRPRLRQLNTRCSDSIVGELDKISLNSGKTKRALLEEAINVLKRKYCRNEC